MDWSNERYVRLYANDTADWVLLSWEARCLFVFLLRKADRSGLVISRSRERGLAALVAMPLEVVQRALPELLEDGCVEQCEKGYLLPNYLDAQESRASDAQRKRAERERRRNGSRGSHDVSHDVTPSHTESQTVTPSSAVLYRTEPSSAVLSNAKPNRTETTGSDGEVEFSAKGTAETLVQQANIAIRAKFNGEATTLTVGTHAVALAKKLEGAGVSINVAIASIHEQMVRYAAPEPPSTVGYFTKGILRTAKSLKPRDFSAADAPELMDTRARLDALLDG